jgi:hypothetical protein
VVVAVWIAGFRALLLRVFWVRKGGKQILRLAQDDIGCLDGVVCSGRWGLASLWPGLCYLRSDGGADSVSREGEWRDLVLLGAWVGGESPTMRQGLACGVILAGVLVTLVGRPLERLSGRLDGCRL